MIWYFLAIAHTSDANHVEIKLQSNHDVKKHLSVLYRNAFSEELLQQRDVVSLSF